MLIVDTRERENRHILSYFDKHNIPYIKQKLDCGDYADTNFPNVVIEKKRDLQECCGNLCQYKARFIREFERAKASQIKIVLLIEHGGDIKTLSDVANWQNPRLSDSPRALTGRELMERLYKLKMAYQCDIEFCDKWQTGERIIKILEGENGKICD